MGLNKLKTHSIDQLPTYNGLFNCQVIDALFQLNMFSKYLHNWQELLLIVKLCFFLFS